MTHPYTPETHPDWAIEEVFKRQGALSQLQTVKAYPGSWTTTLAHAYDIARHENPPVDKAALILADFYEAMENSSLAEAVRDDPEGWRVQYVALRAALKKNGIEI
jgi:hypothetical protein